MAKDTMHDTDSLLDTLKAVAQKLDCPRDQDEQNLLDDVYGAIHDIEIDGFTFGN